MKKPMPAVCKWWGYFNILETKTAGIINLLPLLDARTLKYSSDYIGLTYSAQTPLKK
jgi:hypothetical protein